MEAPARSDAPGPVAEEQLAGLRWEIRRSGRDINLVRVRTAAWIAVPVLLWALLALAFDALSWRDLATLRAANGQSMPTKEERVREFLGIVGLITAGATIAGLSVAEFARTQRRHELLEKLQALSQPEQVNLLAPLVGEAKGDAEKILRPLLRDLGLPTELTPTGTPDGGGAEVSGVGS